MFPSVLCLTLAWQQEHHSAYKNVLQSTEVLPVGSRLRLQNSRLDKRTRVVVVYRNKGIITDVNKVYD